MPHPSWEWSQESDKLEMRVPLSSFNGSINAKSLDVLIKEKDILCIKHEDDVVLQQRLHDDIKLDNWAVENGNTLVIELNKDAAEPWPCLLRQPMRADDARLMRLHELDALLQTEMARLPVDEELEAEAAAQAAATETKPEEAEDDFDDLLEDALDEVTTAQRSGSKPEEADDEPRVATEDLPEHLKRAVEFELRMTKEEFEDIAKKRDEAKAELEKEDLDDETREKHRDVIRRLDKLEEISKRVRRLRSKRVSIRNLLEVVQLEIWKGRIQHGFIEETETEAFRDDEEREMTADQLLKKGVAVLNDNVEEALHFVRLAAIHHNHPVSACLLQQLYSHKRMSPLAMYFIMRRAVMDDCDSSTNLTAGEFCDRGIPPFAPYMALVVYFYQRAAVNGSTHAMVTLANTWRQGAATSSASDEALRTKNLSNERFLSWLQCAEDRGSPRAYVLKASLHTTGECGVDKSGKDAKAYLDRVKKTEPTILAKVPGLESRISFLLREEGGASSDATPAMSPTASSAGAMSSRPGTDAARPSAASRLQALDSRGGAGAMANMDAQPRRGGMLAKGRGSTGSNKWREPFEKAAKYFTAVYFAYCALFPLRLIIAGPAFEFMANAMESVGLGSYIAASPSGMGGM